VSKAQWDANIDAEFIKTLIRRIENIKAEFGIEDVGEWSGYSQFLEDVGEMTMALINDTYQEI